MHDLKNIARRLTCVNIRFVSFIKIGHGTHVMRDKCLKTEIKQFPNFKNSKDKLF